MGRQGKGNVTSGPDFGACGFGVCLALDIDGCMARY